MVPFRAAATEYAELATQVDSSPDAAVKATLTAFIAVVESASSSARLFDCFLQSLPNVL